MANDAGPGFKGLRLHNTLAREKQDFVPLDPANVRMYVCGPTVYDYAHIGNARPIIVFDVLFRLLKHLYGEDHVTYVRNITDVDDKIIARAAEEGVSVDEVTTRTSKQFHEDVAALGCLEPTHEPRATQHIGEMIAVIERLIDKGCGYAADGHVLFDVTKFADYGKLSNRSTDEMIAGARVEVAPYKKNPMDFVLWKPSTPKQPGWESPWGRGRPGWHIECSAMSGALLGETFDIHGGGVDLVFPHHENEIAQSRCAHGNEAMARYWLHNGYLQVEGQKMSKSLGNFVTVRELLEEWPGGAIRLAMLQTHYRQPMNWTASALGAARDELESWAITVFDDELLGRFESDRLLNRLAPLDAALVEALSDDLNTPRAIAVLRAVYRKAQQDDRHRYNLLNAAVILGLLNLRTIGAMIPSASGSASDEQLGRHRGLFRKVQAASANSQPANIRQANEVIAGEGIAFEVSLSDGFVQLNRVSDAAVSEETDRVKELIEARAAARAAKDWAEADRIRDELADMGIQLKDSKDPETGEMVTTWEVAR